MHWKGGNGLVKYRQGTTSNLRSYRRYGVMGMADKVIGEDSGGRVWWLRCGTTDIDTEAKEMQDGNRRYLGRWRWRNGLEERRQTRQI